MDVSSQLNGKEPGGQELIEQVVTLTGLPGSMVEKELHDILDLTGQNPASLTLEELRQAMLLYLEALAKSDPDCTEDLSVDSETSLRAAEKFEG